MSTDYNAKYMPVNHLILDTEITVTPTPPALFPKEYLQSYAHSEVVQGGADPSYPTPPYTAVPDLVIDFNWPNGLKRVSGINIHFHNLTAGGTGTLQLYDSQNRTGVKIYDSGAVGMLQYKTLGELDWCIDDLVAIKEYDTGIGQNKFWYFGVKRARSGRITISNPTNTNGYILAGHIFLGEHFTTETNIQYDSIVTPTDTTTHTLRADGTTSATKGTQTVDLGFEYMGLTEQDINQILSKLVYVNYSHTAFFVDLFPLGDVLRNSLHSGVFFFSPPPPSAKTIHGNLNSTPMELRRS